MLGRKLFTNLLLMAAAATETTTASLQVAKTPKRPPTRRYAITQPPPLRLGSYGNVGEASNARMAEVERLCAEAIRPSEEAEAQLAARTMFTAWVECENTSGYPATLYHRNRHDRKAGTHLVPMRFAPETQPRALPLPIRPRVKTEAPDCGKVPARVSKIAEVIEGMGSWEELLQPVNGVDWVDSLYKTLKRSGKADATGRALAPTPMEIPNEAYIPIMRELLELNHTVSIDEHGKPHVMRLTPIHKESRFQPKVWEREAARVGCEDKEALWSFTYGWQHLC